MKEIPPSENRSRMKILIDADVILEVFLNRGGFVEDAELILKVAQSTEHIEFYIMEKCLKRIRIEQDYADVQVAEQSIHDIEMLLQGRIIPHDDDLRELACRSTLRDFDSAEELVCAATMGFDAIVTLNPRNFNGASLPIWSVDNLLVRLKLEKSLKATYPLGISFQTEPHCKPHSSTDIALETDLPKATALKTSTPS